MILTFDINLFEYKTIKIPVLFIHITIDLMILTFEITLF
jgi:hypothetical protein